MQPETFTLGIDGPIGDELEAHLANARSMGLDVPLTLRDCFEWLDSAYAALPDQYEGIVRWRLTRHLTGEQIDETLPGGLWYAYAEDHRAFAAWLRLFHWTIHPGALEVCQP
jgi:hypothetical protein